jgi:hypothetical protein
LPDMGALRETWRAGRVVDSIAAPLAGSARCEVRSPGDAGDTRRAIAHVQHSPPLIRCGRSTPSSGRVRADHLARGLLPISTHPIHGGKGTKGQRRERDDDPRGRHRLDVFIERGRCASPSVRQTDMPARCSALASPSLWPMARWAASPQRRKHPRPPARMLSAVLSLDRARPDRSQVPARMAQRRRRHRPNALEAATMWLIGRRCQTGSLSPCKGSQPSQS